MIDTKGKEHYRFNQNKKCEYFPCHKTENKEGFNCLFCYCPLYMMGEECGGNYNYLESGIKDCSKCILPHIKDTGFDHISSKMMDVIDIVKVGYLKDKN